MTETDARRILGKTINRDNSLGSEGSVDYIVWPFFAGRLRIDGELTVEEVEALAWWMRNMKVKR